MNAAQQIAETLGKGATITEIDMVREVGLERCIDARPVYGPDGKWLKESERGPKCGQQHISVAACGKAHLQAHRCKSNCYENRHVNVPAKGWLIVSKDGKFRAKVFAEVEKLPPIAGTKAARVYLMGVAGAIPSFRTPKIEVGVIPDRFPEDVEVLLCAR